MVKTDTPQVNLHLEATGEDHPDIPVNTDDAAHVELVTEHLIKDVRPVVARFGPERVVVENDHPARGYNLRPVYLPEVIRRVVRETGCGLLLDVGHARLAAHTLGVDLFDYLGQLPTDRLCELHITGMQRFEGRWAQLARRAGFDEATIQEHIGYLVDHLPITDDGWQVYAWAMNQVHQGAWARPWIVTFEYGGADGVWEIMTDPAVLAEQVPRLYRLVKGEATAGEGPEETASR
jgi:uncharacterized protein (UPF0276 family)